MTFIFNHFSPTVRFSYILVTYVYKEPVEYVKFTESQINNTLSFSLLLLNYVPHT